jgi:hypothetical protein
VQLRIIRGRRILPQRGGGEWVAIGMQLGEEVQARHRERAEGLRLAVHEQLEREHRLGRTEARTSDEHRGALADPQLAGEGHIERNVQHRRRCIAGGGRTNFRRHG